ncbi:MAG: Smr/MutS family protein [Spirochaetes bacterium]|nr:Smr/MutS family protein [Spirochaetota bacterium]
MSELFNIELEDEIDVHHFHPKDVQAIISEFLNHAREKGYLRVRIIHGKGRSVLKSLVYAELARCPFVHSYGDDFANWGATIVYLNLREN